MTIDEFEDRLRIDKCSELFHRIEKEIFPPEVKRVNDYLEKVVQKKGYLQLRSCKSGL